MPTKLRCFGNLPNQSLYAQYHDTEWGVPVYDDQRLFELLILEGAQAGLTWEIILKKRDFYRQAFFNFDIQKVAAMTEQQLESLYKHSNIVRNKLKIWSTRTNAQAVIQIQKEFGSFSAYLWNFVNNQPSINHFKILKDLPTQTVKSNEISTDLKKRGMKFVGPTIIYAYMQAVGLVNDHIENCWLKSSQK